MSHHRFHSSAPFGIKVLAVLVAVDGVMAMSDALELLGISLVVALLFAAVGALNLALSYGLWKLEPYAYTLGLGVFGFGLLLDALNGRFLSALITSTTVSMLYHYRGLFRPR